MVQSYSDLQETNLMRGRKGVAKRNTEEEVVEFSGRWL